MLPIHASSAIHEKKKNSSQGPEGQNSVYEKKPGLGEEQKEYPDGWERNIAGGGWK